MGMSAGSFATRVVATIVVALDGTGDTDDVQEGIDLLPATGGSVYVREGLYILTANLTINVNNVSLFGAGRSTQINGINGSPILDSIANYTSVNNIYFHHAGSAFAFNRCLEMNGDHCLVSQCYADNGRTGIDIRGTGSIVIQNIIEDMAGGASAGIAVRAGGSNAINGNVCDNTGTSGIVVEESPKNLVVGNQCLNSANGIIVRGGGNYTIVQGNECNDNTDHGIWIGYGGEGADNNTVIGNQCTGNDDGIEVLNAWSDDNIVVGNWLKGNVTTSLTDGGTGTEIGHNKT